MVRDIIESGWPALLAALSFIIGTNLSDELFVEVLTSYEAMLNVAGMLGLTTPRDAFFTSLAKLAVPSRVVSSLDSDAQMPRIMSPSITENLGLAAPSQAPGLSERNMACLKVFVASALSLAGSLGESWYQILEALQNADYVLTFKGTNTGPSSKRGTLSPTLPNSRSASVSSSATQSSVPTAAQASKPSLLSDLDSETLQAAIQRLFDASKNLEDAAFKDFINALCKLSFEMISMQSEPGGFNLIPEDEGADDTASLSSAVLTPKKDAAHRRRVSGIYVPRTLVSSMLVIPRFLLIVSREQGTLD